MFANTQNTSLSFFFSLFLFALRPLEASESEDPSEWTFFTTSYVWFSGLNGTLGVKGHKARTNLSFSDVLSNMEAYNDGIFIGFTWEVR